MVDSSIRVNFSSFSSLISCRISNDKNTSFWFSRWAGAQHLKEAFSKFSALARYPFGSVVDNRSWSG